MKTTNVCSEGDITMSAIDKGIKALIIEQLEKTKDTDLLDLILKLLIAES